MKTEFEMAMNALARPLDYLEKHPQVQWDIDARLGILDWDGINIDKARECIEAEDDARASKDFKMSLPELRLVVQGFDLRIAKQKERKEAQHGDS